MNGCVHRWRIAAPDQAENPRDGLPGTCALCGAERVFTVTDDSTVYVGREFSLPRARHRDYLLAEEVVA